MAKEKKHNTTLAEMVEGKAMTREAFKNLTLEIADDWVRINHPEIKEEWKNICQKPQEIIKLFSDKKKPVKKYDEDGKPIMRTVKKRDGTIAEEQETELIPYKKGEKRLLTAFEICSWLCDKYNMSPAIKSTTKKIRERIGNW